MASIAFARVDVVFQQVGPDVIVTATGSLNFNATKSPINFDGTVASGNGQLYFAPFPSSNPASYFKCLGESPSNFGTDTDVGINAYSHTGSLFGFFATGVRWVFVDPLYASGDPIQSTMTFANHTFASLQLTVAETTFTCTTTALSDTIVLHFPPTVTTVNPSSGSTAGNTLITITGVNFTGATAVTVGGSACAPVTVVDDNTITCTTSAHAAGQASVLVTTPGGTNPANTLFTYTAPPTPPPSGPAAPIPIHPS